MSQNKAIKQFLTYFLCAIALNSMGKGIDYSQPYTNLLYTNPAFAGTNVCPRLYSNYRSKSSSYDRAYKTYFASYDQAIRMWDLDVGGIVYQDEEANGGYSYLSFSPIVGKAKDIGRNATLKLSLQMDLMRTSVSSEGRTYPDMIDPVHGYVFSTGEDIDSYSQIDVGASVGLLFYAKRLFVGVAMHNITAPKTEFSDKHTHFPRKYSAQLGYELISSNSRLGKQNVKLFPALYVQHESGYGQSLLGVTGVYQVVFAGIYAKISGLSSVETLAPAIGIHQKRFKFAYSCDFHLAGQRKKEKDTHEVSLTWYLPCSDYTPKHRSISCPSI